MKINDLKEAEDVFNIQKKSQNRYFKMSTTMTTATHLIHRGQMNNWTKMLLKPTIHHGSNKSDFLKQS